MIEWNITKLMSKDQDKAKEATRKQILKDLGGGEYSSRIRMPAMYSLMQVSSNAVSYYDIAFIFCRLFPFHLVLKLKLTLFRMFYSIPPITLL